MRISLAALVAVLALSLPVLATPALAAEAAADDAGPGSASDIVVTARIEDRDLQDLRTLSLGIGIGAEQIGAINAVNAEDVVR